MIKPSATCFKPSKTGRNGSSINLARHYTPSSGDPVCALSFSAVTSPLRVLGAVERGGIRTALHVVDTRFGGGIVRIGFCRNGLPGAAALRERIFRQLSQVPVADEGVERTRILRLVRVVLVDGLAHPVEIFMEHRLARMNHARAVLRQTHRRQHHDHREHDEQLDEREPALTSLCTSCHRVPSLRTSYTRRTRSDRPTGWNPACLDRTAGPTRRCEASGRAAPVAGT